VEEEMREARWEEVAREVEAWEREQIKNLLEGVELIDSANEGICQRDLPSDAALKDVKLKNVAFNCDESSLEGASVVSESGNAIALPNSAQQEEEGIPRVIVTTSFPGAIAISSGTQVQKVNEQGGSDLGVVVQDGSAIAPTNITQEESEPVPRVIVTAYAKGAIATSSVPQQQVSKPQAAKDIASPVLQSAKSQPVVPKKLSDEEIQRLEDELKRLSINPDSCMEIVRKYWGNVQGAIARVKEAIQAGWCRNATGLFIASCKKGVKPEKSQVSNEVNEWFNWARARRIVLAMSGDVAYTTDRESVSIRKMMELHPMKQ